MARFTFFCVIVAAIVAVVVPGTGIAAKPVFHEHANFSDTFADNICGIDGTSVLNIVDNFTVYADGTFRDTSNFNLVFTATTSGKSVQIFSAGQVSGLADPIDNGDGTITFVNTFKGLPEKLKIPMGPTLSRDAGVVTLSDTFDATTFDFLFRVVSGEKGPHPDLDSDFAVFCDVLIPPLT